jgi:hypothetical protein
MWMIEKFSKFTGNQQFGAYLFDFIQKSQVFWNFSQKPAEKQRVSQFQS